MDKYISLLNNAEKVKRIYEKSIFSIAGKGHYENPITDLLAFFCNPKEPHGLDGLILSAIFKILKLNDYLSSDSNYLSEPPYRELATEQKNRIDLLLCSNEWVLLIENKIFHEQVNPFDDYIDFVKKHYAKDKQLIPVVLSPKGDAPKNWSGISYEDLINQLKSDIGFQLTSLTVNKWFILFREFLLNLENVTMEKQTDIKEQKFIFENLKEINELISLRDNVYQQIQQSLFDSLQTDAKVPVSKKIHSWDGPAFRFAATQWNSPSDIVVYIPATNEHNKVQLRIYPCRLNENNINILDEIFKDTDYSEIWYEKNQEIKCFCKYYDEFNFDLISNDLNCEFAKLAKFESLVR